LVGFKGGGVPSKKAHLEFVVFKGFILSYPFS
jgi:hypothetical protein